jgi:hypothetical protein
MRTDAGTAAAGVLWAVDKADNLGRLRCNVYHRTPVMEVALNGDAFSRMASAARRAAPRSTRHRATGSRSHRQERAILIRDIFGNPFRPAAWDPVWLSWNGGTIPTLAQSAYDDRELPSGYLDRVRLALQADMLEDAGCSDPAILEHLRGPGPHVRGCWIVDLLLGKG